MHPPIQVHAHHYLLAISVVTGLAVVPSTAVAASFTSLSAHFAGEITGSSAWAISGDGSAVTGWADVVVGYSTPIPGGPEVPIIEQWGYRWQIGSNAGLLPSAMDIGTDISHDGSVIVGNHYRWTDVTGPQDLGTLGSGTSAYGVSGDGDTVTGFSDGPDGREAFRWTPTGGIEGLGFLPATTPLSRGQAVSGDGSVIVGSGNGGAWRWTEGTGIALLATTGPLNEPFLGQPNGISADGATVVGQGGGAWMWTAADGVQFLPGAGSQAAYAASADGSVIVGGDQYGPSIGIAFLWDETNGIRPLKTVLEDAGLDLTGWTLYAALGISDDGTKIVGKGTNPFGVTEAWYADLTAVPVPPAIYLVGSGVVGIIGFARRRAAAKT